MAHTQTVLQDSLDSQYLSSSMSSLSRSRSTNSLIVRTYKEATQLYLTRRFKEALEILEPIISPRQSSEANHVNGLGETTNGDVEQQLAPVANSSRGTRTKVWVFYLTLLHAIIELGAEQGKLEFGSSRWRELANKAREGTIWDQVVDHGYGGNEGEIDGEVVNNLATLLLSHMQDQKYNQTKLEAYLAASNDASAGDMAQSHISFQDGSSTPSTHSSSPKALQTRLKILELYTMHVLPQNGEYDYAKEFIENCDSLDEERREAFLAALQQIVDEKEGTAQREKELEEQREREMEQAKREEEEARLAEEKRIEEERKKAEAERQQKAQQARPTSLNTNNTHTANGHATAKTPIKPSSSQQTPGQNKRSNAKKPAPPAPTLYRRAGIVFGNIQKMVMAAGQGLTAGGTMAMLRMLMFVLAFVLLLARRDLRLRVKRALENGITKIKQTVGMGVKVSYI